MGSKEHPHRKAALWNHPFVNPNASAEYYLGLTAVVSNRPIPLLKIAICDCFQI